MNIADIVEDNRIDQKTIKEICESFDKTKNEDGENIDLFFTKLLKDKGLWNYMK